MKISELITDLNIDASNISIHNEQEFETLGLTASVTEKSMCTFLDNEKYIDSLPDNVSMVITTKEIAPKIASCGICIVDNPRIFFFNFHNSLKNNSLYVRKNCKTTIGENCSISKQSYIAENNVVIGNNVIIEEFVSIKANTVIGDNSIIRAGSIIGGVGFEFKNLDDSIMGVEHYGGVIIGSNVEIQQNVIIDRAIYPWDDTKIGNYTKIADSVHISHAVKISKNVMVAAQACILGRALIGENTWIGPKSAIRNGIHIGSNSRVNMGAVVSKDVADGQSVTGNFAIEHSKFIENLKKNR